jgi:hypothetical protein
MADGDLDGGIDGDGDVFDAPPDAETADADPCLGTLSSPWEQRVCCNGEVCLGDKCSSTGNCMCHNGAACFPGSVCCSLIKVDICVAPEACHPK